MKEKIGIEKLIELLNEFEISKSHRDYEWRIEKKSKERPCGTLIMGMSGEQFTGAYIDDEEMERIIISKKYEFIKWLVNNDKIDTNNLSLKAFKNIFSGGGFVEVSDLEVLLMLLSISDTPIEDLILYLK